MGSKFVDPDPVLQDIFEQEIEELRSELAAAKKWSQRARIKREIRRTRRRLHQGVLRRVAQW
jgi:phage shock protein A